MTTDPVPRGHRPKPARDSRLAASGLAFCAVAGMVLGMTLGQSPTPATTTGAASPGSPVVFLPTQDLPVTGDGSASGAGAGTVSPPAAAPAPPPTSSGGS